MAEYIKRDDVIKTIEFLRPSKKISDDIVIRAANKAHDFIRTAVETIPAADVVQVVRCKHCKHWTKKLYFGGKELVIEGRLQGECECLPIPNHTDDYLLTEDDFFCARGERRENND